MPHGHSRQPQNPFLPLSGAPTTPNLGLSQTLPQVGGQDASLFGLGLPGTFALGQGLGLVGDIFSGFGRGGRRRRAGERVEGSLTGLEGVAGQEPFDPFQVASFAAQPVRREAEKRGELLQEVTGNVFAPDVQGALFEEFAPQFAAIFGGAKQRAGEIQLSNKMQAALARLQAQLQAQELEFR